MKVLALYALLVGEWGIERILVLILSKIHQWRRLLLHPHHRLTPHHVKETFPGEAYGLWTLVARRRNKLRPNISKPIANHKSKAQFPINQYRDTLPNQPHISPPHGSNDRKRKSHTAQSDVKLGLSASYTQHLMRQDKDIVFGLEMPDERPLSQSPILTHTNSTLLDPSPHSTSPSTLPSQTKKSLSQHTQNKAQGSKNPSLKLKGKEKALTDPGNPRMEDLLQGEDHSPFIYHDKRNQSNPNSHHGMVRGRTDEGIEPHFPPHP